MRALTGDVARGLACRARRPDNLGRMTRYHRRANDGANVAAQLMLAAATASSGVANSKSIAEVHG
jgi:hypothetical protein